MNLQEKITGLLDFIYSGNYDKTIAESISSHIETCKNEYQLKIRTISEKDIILITYGDSITKKDKKPLLSLHEFLQQNFKDIMTMVHILPFFPSSSDGGFSVIDYLAVDAALGSWNDIEAISSDFELMLDMVINHTSQESLWFKNYLQNLSPGKDFFIEVNPDTDLSSVTRPRNLPLLTPFKTAGGTKYLWTTFSSDQIDLNFKNPALLLEMIDVLLDYIKKGAKIIRLDAVAFIWKEAGTSCLHLPQTHAIVKLFRTIIDSINPEIILLTETNVPSRENLSYFGNGNEARMIYQFSLPPLLLYTLFTGNSSHLISWAKSLPDVPAGCTYLNFTASHDGIGVRPLEGIISLTDYFILQEGMKRFGGLISNKNNPDGSTSPYEINITYFDALKGTQRGKDKFQAERFICSQTIMLALKGIPAFYLNSLFSAENDLKAVYKTGFSRTINRHKWTTDEIDHQLKRGTIHSYIFQQIISYSKIRSKTAAFHPDAPQDIIDAGDDVFIISRNHGEIVSISNITSEIKDLDLCKIYPKEIFLDDLLEDGHYFSHQIITILPYKTVWLKTNAEL